MNFSIIRVVIGNIIRIEGAFFLIPAITCMVFKEEEMLVYFGMCIACLIFGTLLCCKKPHGDRFYAREGCLVTALGWIVVSVIGAIPFVLTGEIPNYLNALFETVSGFTTTGASILSDPEAISNGSNIWRCFTHWVGGMGVLVFMLAVIPMTNGSDINIMKAESPGPSVSKLVPQIKNTTQYLYLIYGAISLTMFICLLIAKMPAYDALCAVFGTAGTGGFGIKADSMTSYSVAIQTIITVFMILFGINFNFYYLLLFRHFKKAFAIEEIRAYLFVIAFAIITISVNAREMFSGIGDALSKSSFTVASIITTTGYSNCDFDQWPTYSKIVLVLLMFVGACAGSTGGGMKVSRILILLKTLKKELGTILHPKAIKKLKLDGIKVEHEVLRSVNVYFATFMMIFAGSVLIVSLDNEDIVTTVTSVAACINNIGPGLAKVGATCNYGFLSWHAKLILILDMLIGRLELFPILILFHPGLWSGCRKSGQQVN